MVLVVVFKLNNVADLIIIQIIVVIILSLVCTRPHHIYTETHTHIYTLTATYT